MVAAAFRAGQQSPQEMHQAGGGPVDIAMTAIGIGFRERAVAVLGEHVGEDAIYTAIEELGAELGIPIRALRPGEEPPPGTDLWTPGS